MPKLSKPSTAVRKRPPTGYRFVKLRESTKLRYGHWWKESSGYIRVWPDELGESAGAARLSYTTHPIAGRFVKKSGGRT